MNSKVPIDQERLAEFCRRNGVCRLAAFGSAPRDDFGPSSDVDVLIEFEPGWTPGPPAWMPRSGAKPEHSSHDSSQVQEDVVSLNSPPRVEGRSGIGCDCLMASAALRDQRVTA